MYFIGSGALLTHAIAFARDAGLRVDGACCAPGDAAGARLRALGVPVLDSTDPNGERDGIALRCGDGIVFSINNKHLLRDPLLQAGLDFFNIHNGLTQDYRGIAEICIFAAICRGADAYGVTLQQVLPGQRVDSGPVVAQIGFEIMPTDGFEQVLEKSLNACRQIFEQNVATIADCRHQTKTLPTAANALSYRDIAAIAAAAAQADPARLARAAALGRYAGFFPALKAALAALPPAPA